MTPFAAELIGTRVGGYPLDLHIVPTNEWIDANDLDNAVVGVIQVDPLEVGSPE